MDMEMLLRKILNKGWIKQKDKVLIICGSQEDDAVMKKFKFKNYLITSAYKKLPIVKNYLQADAQKLPFVDHSFDVVIVNAGLHHCASPHQALCEMYRVAKRKVIVHESQDTWATRFMVRCKIAFDYETGSLDSKDGGVNNTAIPNFVYRWSRREVLKTINSYNPTKLHEITFFSSFRYYPFYFEGDEFLGKTTIVKLLGKRITLIAMNFLIFGLNLFMENYGNDFAFIVHKDKSRFQPWINPKKDKLLRLIPT